VHLEVLSRSALAGVARREFTRQMPREVVGAQGAFLVLLGLVPAGFDYEQAVFALVETSLAGLYDPRREVLYVAEDQSDDELVHTLAHELTHALQDQAHDLDSVAEYRANDGDATAAVLALAEGEALAVSEAAVPLMRPAERALGSDSPTRDPSGKLDAVPPIVLRSLLAPYVDGRAFVDALRSERGWTGVDEAWRVRPVSTEQLLHPSKWRAGELPEDVRLGLGLAKECEFSDRMGEQAVRLVFEEWQDASAASVAASDWAGDQWALCGPAGARRLVWRLRWDTVAAADRGWNAWLSALRRVTGREQERACGQREGISIALERRGRDVAVVSQMATTESPSASCADLAALAARALGP
jgi:hypothetical protein